MTESAQLLGRFIENEDFGVMVGGERVITLPYAEDFFVSSHVT